MTRSKWLWLSVAVVPLAAWVLTRPSRERPSDVIDDVSAGDVWNLTSPMIVDLGNIQIGTVVDRQVLVANDSGQPLDLSRPRVSCGCLTADLHAPAGVESVTVQSGGRLGLHLVLHTAALRGSFRHAVYLPVRSPTGTRESMLVVSGVALAPVQSLPGEIDLGDVPAGSSQPFVLTFTGQPSALSGPLVAHATHPEIRVARLDSETNEAGGRVLTGTVTVPASGGEVAGRVVLMTTTGRELCATLVRVAATRMVVARPNFLTFPSPDLDSPHKTSVLFEADAQVELRLVATPGPNFDVAVSGRTASVRVLRYPPDIVRTSLAFEATTADGRRSAVRVPVTVYPSPTGTQAGGQP